jgi:DNA-binding MarR family transcriptional regulator
VDREETIIRDLLEHIDRGEEVNQRKLASDLGIALGMTNTYVKRCVRKGLIKVSEVPARRYRYYLTPKGFAEKSRLTAEYFSESLRFFRRARQSFDRLMDELEAAEIRRIAICGAEDLAEIAVLCSLNRPITVAGVVRTDKGTGRICGVEAVDGDAVADVERWVIAVSHGAADAYAEACAAVGEDRVVVPDILHGFIARGRG